MARFFMFVLKGYAYLNMRLGDIEEGRAAVAKLLELDPTDKVGARDPARGSRTTGARRCRLKSTRRSTGSALPWTAASARILPLREAKKCQPLRACVFDRYARRIDRFFDWNPDLAASYLRHPYFEVRACAAKAADIFLLPPMLSDPEEAVRWSAARRLPNRYLLKLRDDPHREVRIRVAQRLDPADLRPMISDEDYAVRQVVARRISVDLLILMVRDLDVEVRRAVARRIPMPALTHSDRRRGGEHSRRGGAASAGGRALRALANDADWRVRYEVARRAAPAYLAPLANDEDPMVREIARERLWPHGAGADGRSISRTSSSREH